MTDRITLRVVVLTLAGLAVVSLLAMVGLAFLSRSIPDPISGLQRLVRCSSRPAGEDIDRPSRAGRFRSRLRATALSPGAVPPMADLGPLK